MRYPSMWPKRTKAAAEYYRAVEREQAEREATARRTQLLQDRSFLPMRQEGMRAHGAGKLRSENPFVRDTGPFVAWDVGWRDANDAER